MFSFFLTKFPSILQKHVEIVNCTVNDFISNDRRRVAELFDPNFLARIFPKFSKNQNFF